MTKRFLWVFTFYIAYQFAFSFGVAFSNLWFLRNDFSYTQIVSFSLVTFLTPLVVFFLVPFIKLPAFFIISVILSMTNSLLLIRFLHPVQPYVIAVIWGSLMVFFYTGYNILHFGATKRGQTGFSTSLYFLVGPVLGIFTPIIAGLIGKYFGLQTNYLVGLILYTIPLVLTKQLPSVSLQFSIIERLARIKKIFILIIFQGISETVIFVAIPVFTLFFIDTPLKLGLFTSYLVAVAATTNIILGKVSDKIKNRGVFIYPFSIILSASILGLALSKTLALWIMFSTLVSLSITFVWPFMTAIVVDLYSDSKISMIPREFLANLGRLVGTLIIFLSLQLWETPSLGILVLGLFTFLYPIIMARTKLPDISY